MGKGMNARKFRLLLISFIIILIAGGVGIFLFGYGLLSKQTVEASEISTRANQSNQMLTNLMATENELRAQGDTVERVSRLVSDSQSYEYQNRIVSDINTYADKAGVEVMNIDFSAQPTPGAGTTTAAQGSPATPTTPTTNGLRTASATVTLQNPVDYNNMLKFLGYMEQSLTRMSISKISLSKADSKDEPSAVNSDVLLIEVYIR